MKPKKIIYILSQFPEIHETFILREIKALKDRGIDILILSLKPCRDKVIHDEARELMKKTIYGKVHGLWFTVHSILHPVKTISTFFYVVKTYSKSPKEFIKAIYVWLECFYFARIIHKEKIMHIHSHWATMPTTAAVILSKLTGVPFSFTAHAWDIFVNCDGLEGKINKAKFVVTCTDYNRKFLSHFCKNGQHKKVHLNYHGIDVDKFTVHSSQLTSKLVILAIGRLVETKGFEYLIEACRILNDKEISFECRIVGSGPLENKLKSLAISYGLRDRINFLGIRNQEEIKKLYSEATVLTQPSVMAKNGDRDGIPNVILEAMALGAPVIATNFSGISEAVIDKDTGILVPDRDSSALAEAIVTLWQDEQLRERLSLNGRKLIESKFNTDTNIKELLTIFTSYGVLN